MLLNVYSLLHNIMIKYHHCDAFFLGCNVVHHSPSSHHGATKACTIFTGGRAAHAGMEEALGVMNVLNVLS